MKGEIKGKVALHLFSGAYDREDGLAAALRGMGWTCIDFDNKYAQGDDLANDEVWERIFAAVTRDLIAFVWMGPPCTSFSPARRHKPGPRAVRDAAHPRGFPKDQLTPAEVEQVRLANYFVVQCCRVATAAHGRWIGFAIENPIPWDDPQCASMFHFEEFEAVLTLQGVRFVDFDQCTQGAETVKPTRVVFLGIDIGHWEMRCDHPPCWQWCEFRDASGRHVWERQWTAHPRMIKARTMDGEWASKAAAAYPGKMNAAIARAIAANTRWEQPTALQRKRPAPANTSASGS